MKDGGATAGASWPPRSSDSFARIGRLPAYVFAQLNEEKRLRVEAGDDVIDLGMGNPDLGTPPHIVRELVEHAALAEHHRYSASRGIQELREAIAEHYDARYGVRLDPEREAVVTIGAQEGIAHLMLAILDQGDTVLVPVPAYPIHTYSVTFAGGRVVPLPLPARGDGRVDGDALLAAVAEAAAATRPSPRALLLSFPNNPTALVADRDFFRAAVEVCRRHRLLLIHDFAYADCWYEEEPPSVLQIPGAREIAVEFYSMSKSYRMAGWRVGYCVGNAPMVQALTRMKSYLDYGIFQPIQIAAVRALRGPQECVAETRLIYRRRRDALVGALRDAGWGVPAPVGTMFLWAAIPEAFRHRGSAGFASLLLREAGVVLSPGSGFGAEGEGFVRFALVEEETRLREAARRIGAVIRP